MKRLLMIFLAVLMAASAASAQTSGYIGLFVDDTHTSWCGTGFGEAVPLLNVYVFGLPRAGGTFGAEFMIDFPDDPTMITAGATFANDPTVILGSLSTGVSLGYDSCITGWFLIATQPMYTTSANRVVVQIVANPSSGGVFFTECEGIRPVYDAIVFTNVYINYENGVDPECAETGTAESSWGAIKSMYSE